MLPTEHHAESVLTVRLFEQQIQAAFEMYNTAKRKLHGEHVAPPSEHDDARQSVMSRQATLSEAML